MRVPHLGVPCAALAAATALVACRAIEGLDELKFDVGSGGASASCPCGEALPQGWSGPIAVHEGPPGTTPGCPPEYPIPVLDGGVGPDAAPATCSACTCGAPQVTCNPGAVAASTHSGCNGGKQTVLPAAGVCALFAPSGDYFVQSPAQVTVGPCPPAGGVASLPPPGWGKEAVACGLAADSGCNCAPPPPSPFEARTCVWRTGVHACPVGFPVDRGWASLADTRGCAPCTCAAATPAATCTVTIGLFGDTQCQDHLSDLGPAGACGEQWGVHSVLATATASGSPACAPGGGAPVGAASAEQTVTICCAP